MTNCPNCGAPIVAAQCEYCGTRFERWTLASSPHDRLAKLVEDKPNITSILTPNELREAAGLKPIKEETYMIENNLRISQRNAQIIGALNKRRYEIW